MAKVTLENIYKSFPNRNNSERAATQSIAKPTEKTSKPKQANRGISVLKAINLEIQDGEFMVLVGPSGCGKSTLLRAIAGLEELTGGNIWVGDRLVNNLPPKERDIAMVFQNYALYPHLNVYDNIAFGLRRTIATEDKEDRSKGVKTKPLPKIVELLENLLRAMTRSLPRKMRYLSKKEREIEIRVREAAKLLQIETLLERYPKELSGGQKQRVALGRAIARNPRLFLMDEPLSNLDAKLRAETRSQIVKLQRHLETTTIYVTHDRVEAMTMGDRIAVMNQGQIQQIAPPLEIYDRPANIFVAQFMGSPAMNLIQVRLERGINLIHPQFRLTLSHDWNETLKSYQDRSLLLGIRPEHFEIDSLKKEDNLVIKVEQVEALGNETYIAFNLDRNGPNRDAKYFQAKISPDRLVQPGEEICLSIVQDKIHLFEVETGRAISPDRAI